MSKEPRWKCVGSGVKVRRWPDGSWEFSVNSIGREMDDARNFTAQTTPSQGTKFEEYVSGAPLWKRQFLDAMYPGYSEWKGY